MTLALSGSVPLLIVVLGLVQYYKKLNATGNLLSILSMITGVLFGGFYLYLVTEPTAMLGIFLCIIYGIVIGLIASGVYDLAKQLITPTQRPPDGKG